MKKEFVPYDLSLRMKQLGFDEPCIMYIDDEGDLIKDDTAEWIGAIKCPLKSQAFRWFREKYKLHHFIIERDGYMYHAVCQHSFNKPCKTYEEAELACLTKLIEIVEQKEKEDESKID